MRGIYSSVTDIRRKVFTEVARMAYEGTDYSHIEELPYKIVPGEVERYRESIFPVSYTHLDVYKRQPLFPCL